MVYRSTNRFAGVRGIGLNSVQGRTDPNQVPLRQLIEQYELDLPVATTQDRLRRDTNLRQLLRTDRNAVRRLVEAGKVEAGEQELFAEEQERINSYDEADRGINIDRNRMSTRLDNAFRQGEQLRMNRLGNYQNNILRSRFGGFI